MVIPHKKWKIKVIIPKSIKNITIKYYITHEIQYNIVQSHGFIKHKINKKE